MVRSSFYICVLKLLLRIVHKIMYFLKPIKIVSKNNLLGFYTNLLLSILLIKLFQYRCYIMFKPKHWNGFTKMILMVCSQDRLWDVLLLLILLLMVIVWTSFTQQPSHNQFETMAKREVIYNTVTTAYSRRPKETTTPCYLTQKLLLLPPPCHEPTKVHF